MKLTKYLGVTQFNPKCLPVDREKALDLTVFCSPAKFSSFSYQGCRMHTAVDMLDVICRRIKAHTAATLCWTILKLLGTVSVLSKYYHMHIRGCGTFWPNLITAMWKIIFQTIRQCRIWVWHPSVLNFSAPRQHLLQKLKPNIKEGNRADNHKFQNQKGTENKKAKMLFLSFKLNAVKDFASGTENFSFSKAHISGRGLLNSLMRYH